MKCEQLSVAEYFKFYNWTYSEIFNEKHQSDLHKSKLCLLRKKNKKTNKIL